MSISTPRRFKPAGWALLLAGLTAAVYANTIPGKFVWDDEQFVYRNAYVTSPGHLRELLTQNIVAGAGLTSNLYRPVQTLTHRVDYLVWKLNPAGHRLTNVMLQTLVALLLFLWLGTFVSARAAFFSAAFFTVHPIQTEAVAYVSGRGDLLALLFSLSGLLLFRKNRAAAWVCAALAVFSKESHVLFPVFLTLDLYGRSGGKGLFSFRETFRKTWPFWGLAAGYTALRLTVLNFKNTLNFYTAPNILTTEPLTRLWTYCTTLPKGILLWLWPSDLHHERSWSVFASPTAWPVVSGAAVILLCLLLAWRLRKISPLAAAGIFWFFAATFPTSNLVVLINAIFYDHWFILPGVGFCLIAAAGLETLNQKTGPRFPAWVILTVLSLCLALLVGTTLRYNRIWRTPVSLYTEILRWEPRSAKMNSNLGMALADSGDVRGSIAYYKQTIAISDEYPQTHHNLAMSYLALGRVDDAEREYRRALEIDPTFFHSWLYLGMIAAHRGDATSARAAFKRVLEIYPYSEPAKKALAQLGEAL